MNKKVDDFESERKSRLKSFANNSEFHSLSLEWVRQSMLNKYVYNFDWLGRPIIQFPQDIVGVQELVWRIKPDLIIETGIAHGGSLVLSASMLALLDVCEAIENDELVDIRNSQRKVLGIDIDIREPNRDAIEKHPLSSRISMIEGSSIDPDIIRRVKHEAVGFNRIVVFLDSNHTYEHVLAELEAYSPLVSLGSYCVVFDTFVDDVPKETFTNRPWGPENNPKKAVIEFVKNNTNFLIDTTFENKLMITVAPGGFLQRI